MTDLPQQKHVVEPLQFQLCLESTQPPLIVAKVPKVQIEKCCEDRKLDVSCWGRFPLKFQDGFEVFYLQVT